MISTPNGRRCAHRCTHSRTRKHRTTASLSFACGIRMPFPMTIVSVICSVLQRVAACCSVLQCGIRMPSPTTIVLVMCSVLRHVVACCSVLERGIRMPFPTTIVLVMCTVLQCVAVCCSVLQCVAMWDKDAFSNDDCIGDVQFVAVCFSVLQHVAVQYSVFQHLTNYMPRVGVATVMQQCVAVYCSM